MTAVDHDCELDRSRAPEGGEGVEGGAHRATGEEDVVDQHDDLAAEVDGDVGDGLGQHGAKADVVAVESHVERPHGHVGAVDVLQDPRQPVGDGDASRLEADDHHVVETVVALDDLVGDAHDRPPEIVGVHDLCPGNKNAPERGRRRSFAFSHCACLLRAGLTGPALTAGSV